MLVQDLIEEASLHVGDPNFAQITRPQWLVFLQSAARDMYAAGWLLHTSDDTSLIVTANTYTYPIPRPFAYLREVRQEETVNGGAVYVRKISDSHWEPRLQNGIPVLFFFTISSLELGKHLLLDGQSRPTVYATLGETIDPGTETFLRERAIGYAARFMGAGVSEFAHWRQIVSGTAIQMSERTLRLMPQEFRVMPSSRLVPGRQV